MPDATISTTAYTTPNGTAYTRHILYPDGSPAERASVTYRDDLNPATDPVYAVVYFHGVGGNVTNFDGTRNAEQRNALMDDGRFIIIQSDGALKNWGNDPGWDAYAAAFDYASRTHIITATLSYGQSMGGLLGLLSCTDPRFGTVIAHLGISPVCSLAAAWDDGYSDDIQAAYGFTSGTFDDVATAGHDPLGDYPDHAWEPVRIRLLASPDDLAVTKGWHSDAFAAKVAASVREVAVVECSGGHLSNDHYRTADMMAFFERAITNTDPEPPPPITGDGGAVVRVGGEWKPATSKVKANGRWEPAAWYVRDSGQWVPVGG